MTKVVEGESRKLDSIAERNFYSHEIYLLTLDYAFRILEQHYRPGRILELGPADGCFTEHLVRLGCPLTVVESVGRYCKDIADRHPRVDVVKSLFETYEPDNQFDTIVLGHVLEHVRDPQHLLSRARSWLTPDGIIFAAVPNSRSLHRQVAVCMGLLEFEEQLNELDLSIGHRRVYNPETFRRDFVVAGLKVKKFGGYFIKSMSQQQIAKIATPDIIEGLCVIGERYPDIAAELYIVAQ